MKKSILIGIILTITAIFIAGFFLAPHMLPILQHPPAQESTTNQPMLAWKWTSEDGFLTIYNVSATLVGCGLLEVYMTINNTRSTEDRLIGCEIHNLTDVDWEIQVEGRRNLELRIPASSEIRLDYTGSFLRIYKRGACYEPLVNVGSVVDLTLIFDKAERIEIKVLVTESIPD